jgi:hypothetical protein
VTGSRVQLPDGVRPPFEVFVNGVRQAPGHDYRVAEGQLVFARALVAPAPDTARSVVRGFFFGRYRTEHVVDVVYHSDGRTLVASGLRILADGS